MILQLFLFIIHFQLNVIHESTIEKLFTCEIQSNKNQSRPKLNWGFLLPIFFCVFLCNLIL